MKQRSKRRDAQAIAHHYDISNDFYALFLDPLMLYTCAYYRDPDGKLEEAQRDKVDLVCRKLRLKPGETLLDIGCGWGGLSIWAAQHYGVIAHGVTLSRAQAEWAAARIKREGLEGRCLVEYRDHRDLPAGARYDKIAAIGVIEHVGVPNYPAFFARVHEMLNDGGLYLNHGIHHEFHWKKTSHTDFLYEQVFPNGDLSGVSETMTEMERRRLGSARRGEPAPPLRAHLPALGGAPPGPQRRSAGDRGRAHLPDLAPVPGVLVDGLRGRLDRALPVPAAQAVGQGGPCRAHDSRRPLRLRRPPPHSLAPPASGWDNRENVAHPSPGGSMNTFARSVAVVAVCLLAVLALETPAGAVEYRLKVANIFDQAMTSFLSFGELE